MAHIPLPKSEYFERKPQTHSALGEYSHPTISSQKKARSRSSSQKSRIVMKRPTSKYEKSNASITLAMESREQIEIFLPKEMHPHVVVGIDLFKKGFMATLTTQKDQVVTMRVYPDHIQIQQNSVNQSLSIQPIGPQIKKVKIGFGQWGNQEPFSIRIKSFEGRINPSHVVTNAIALFADDMMSIDPFLMIEEAELLRKKMLLRMNSKKVSHQEPLKDISQSSIHQKQNENPLTRKSSLKVGLGPGLKPSYIQINRANKKQDENQQIPRQPNSDTKKNESQPLDRHIGKYTFKKLREEEKPYIRNTGSWLREAIQRK